MTVEIQNGVPSESWADQVEESTTDSTPVEPAGDIQYKDNMKIVTTYRINEDTGKREKVIRTFMVEKKRVPIAVVERKKLLKFGKSSMDGPGPHVSTTQIAENVRMQFLSTRDSSYMQGENEDEMRRNLQIGARMMQCRYCSSTAHLSAKCPLKSQMEEFQNLSQSTKEPQPAPPATQNGAYVPPSLRAGMGSSGYKDGSRFSDQTACIRVSNLSESCNDDDLRELFKPFGKIDRIFLARDRRTKQSKGYAFITYSERAAAEFAIRAVHGYGYDHLILNVEWAQPARTN